MELKHRISGQKLIVDFSGEIDISNIEMLESQVLRLAEGKKEIIFNFDDVLYIDSMGLSFILKIDSKMRKSGGSLTIQNIFGHVKRIFEVSGMKNYLMISGTSNNTDI
jgi:anti-sigma B factor antagonist